MTKEQINIAIAEAQGFRRCRRRVGGPFGIYYDKEDDDRYWVSPEYIEGFKPPWTDFDGTAYYPLPDYTSDLNAIHEVEKSITDPRKMLDYFNHLARYNDPDARSIQDSFNIITATALQRAEAYLRTIGKWKEE